MNDAAFGVFITDEDVQEAVTATIKKWAPTYLALMERRVGLDPKALPLPRSYVVSDTGELAKKPEEQLPCVAVLLPGTGKNTPKADGEGKYRAGYVLNVAVIVSARDAASTAALAKRYRKALELILIQQPSLGGFAEGLVYQGSRNDDLGDEDGRSIAAGTTVCEVLVRDIAQTGVGFREPPANPYEEANLPSVTSTDVDLEPEEL